MAAKTKERIGTMPCEGKRCKSHALNIPVVVFKNDKGTLSYSCDYCDRGPYARAGTEQHADWMQDVKLFQAAIKPSAAPAPVKEAPAAPVTSAVVAAPEKQSSTTLFG